jgi:DNA-binding transcriptional regulator LsrR (DeoR family)
LIVAGIRWQVAGATFDKEHPVPVLGHLARDRVKKCLHETICLFNNILHLYYVDGLTQTEISQRLGLSTAMSTALQQARKQGYVTITIRTPFQQLFDLEDRLKAIFGLQEAIVIPAVGDTSRSLLNALGTVAADFLLNRLRDGDVLAITPAPPSR